MLQVGITEAGDAALDLSWVGRLKPANVIISKSSSGSFNRALLENRERIIYHCTITGFGGSRVEPRVPRPREMFSSLRHLINNGFPPEQVVLRIDPIVPTLKGLRTAGSILDELMKFPVRRVRYSFLDMYPHVKKRFAAAGIPLPYGTFVAPLEMQDSALRLLSGYDFEFESCAENTPHKTGCISPKDLQILGVAGSLCGTSDQRGTCLCPANKVELLDRRRQCWHGCLYCYWWH